MDDAKLGSAIMWMVTEEVDSVKCLCLVMITDCLGNIVFITFVKQFALRFLC